MDQELSVEAIAARAQALRRIAERLMVVDRTRDDVSIVFDDLAMAERWLEAPNAAARPHILRIASDALHLAESRLRAIDAAPGAGGGPSARTRERVLPLLR
jgi:hypothetical protein